MQTEITVSPITGMLFGIEFLFEPEFTAFDLCLGIGCISVIIWKGN